MEHRQAANARSRTTAFLMKIAEMLRAKVVMVHQTGITADSVIQNGCGLPLFNQMIPIALGV